MVRMNKSLVNNLEKFSNDSTNKICFTIPFNKKSWSRFIQERK